jgi:hypothetical protein
LKNQGKIARNQGWGLGCYIGNYIFLTLNDTMMRQENNSIKEDKEISDN